MLKRIYNSVAVLALIHMFGLAGGLAFLASTGRLTPENARAVVEVFRSEAADSEEGESASGREAPVAQAPAPPPAGSVEEEVARRNLERVIMEANQRLILANRQMVEVKRRREELADREAERAKARVEQAGQSAREGFKKDLEILSVLKPKVALDSLLARPPEDAALILMAMDARRGKRIIEAAQKDPRKRAAMQAIQLKLREQSAGQPLLDESAG